MAAFNLSLILRRETGVGTPRGLQGLRNSLFFYFWLAWTVLVRLRERYRRPHETFDARWHLLPSLRYPLNAT